MGMSGLLAQMGLGAAANVGQGIGDRIRKDAALAREKALNDQRFGQSQELEATRFSNNEAIADKNHKYRGEEINQQSKLTDARDDKNRKHALEDRAYAEDKADKATKTATEKDYAEKRYGFLQSQVEDLSKQEIELTKIAYNQRDESGNPVGLTADQKNKLDEITQRKSDLITEMNDFRQVPGQNTETETVRPTTIADDKLSDMIMRVTPSDEHEFLADLQAEGMDEATVYRAKTMLKNRQQSTKNGMLNANTEHTEQGRKDFAARNSKGPEVDKTLQELTNYFEGFKASPRNLSQQEKDSIKLLLGNLGGLLKSPTRNLSPEQERMISLLNNISR